MSSDKILIKNSPNYDFAVFASIAYSLALYAILDWIILLDIRLTIAIIIGVIVTFLNFSIYHTEISVNCIRQVFPLRLFGKVKKIENILLKKISYRSTTAGTGYFHLYYEQGSKLKKKSVYAKNTLKRNYRNKIVQILEENGIIADGFS